MTSEDSLADFQLSSSSNISKFLSHNQGKMIGDFVIAGLRSLGEQLVEHMDGKLTDASRIIIKQFCEVDNWARGINDQLKQVADSFQFIHSELKELRDDYSHFKTDVTAKFAENSVVTIRVDAIERSQIMMLERLKLLDKQDSFRSLNDVRRTSLERVNLVESDLSALTEKLTILERNRRNDKSEVENIISNEVGKLAVYVDNNLDDIRNKISLKLNDFGKQNSFDSNFESRPDILSFKPIKENLIRCESELKLLNSSFNNFKDFCNKKFLKISNPSNIVKLFNRVSKMENDYSKFRKDFDVQKQDFATLVEYNKSSFSNSLSNLLKTFEDGVSQKWKNTLPQEKFRHGTSSQNVLGTQNNTQTHPPQQTRQKKKVKSESEKTQIPPSQSNPTKKKKRSPTVTQSQNFSQSLSHQKEVQPQVQTNMEEEKMI